MKKMTKHDALVYALNTVIKYNDNLEVCEVLTTMIAQLSKSQDKKDEENAKRRENNQKARALLMETVIPILTDAMSVNDDYTAVEIYERAKDNLPDNFTANKVQAVLLREMKPNVIITEKKNCPNHYRLA